VTKVTFETVETKELELEFNCGQTNKKCVQDLFMSTENALRHLDSKLFIIWHTRKLHKSKTETQ